MSTLSADEMAVLHAELAVPAYAGLTDAQRFDALHRPSSVPNPEPRGTSPVPFGTIDALDLLSPESVGKVLSLPSFEQTVRPMLDLPVKDPASIGRLNAWAAAYAKGGVIVQSEFDGLAAPAPGTSADAPTGLFNRTVPDPDWTVAVPGGPSPRDRLFGPKSWTRADGTTVDYIPLEDVIACR